MPAESVSQRIERDAWGEIAIPADAPWGAQTQRAIEHFAISTERMPPELIQAMALVKACAARVNADLGVLDGARARAIADAAAAVQAGRHADAFPLAVWQSGSGTQTHMNLNEVLAHLASTDALPVHPNDHVNLGQSSNDVVPTAIHVATLLACERLLLPALADLRNALADKLPALRELIKIGRTHLQLALPLSVGDEVGAWVAQLDQARRALDAPMHEVQGLAIGGTAVGGGDNTDPAFGDRVAQALAAATGFGFRRADNPFAAQAAHDALLQLHAALRSLALALRKIADDLRWLASPALGEWRLPSNEPGSSIMPGKVNPTQCEALLMVCAQVVGNDVAIGFGSTLAQFQMHAAKPLLALNLLQSIRLLGDGMRSFNTHAVQGMTADPGRIAQSLSPAMLQATRLQRHVGYEAASSLYRAAQAGGRDLRDLAIERGLASAEQFDAWTQ